MKVKGIKRGQSTEPLKKINSPDGVGIVTELQIEIVIELQDVKAVNSDAGEEMREEQAKETLNNQPRPPVFSSTKGLIWRANDFDKPLENITEYRE